jgi:transposase
MILSDKNVSSQNLDHLGLIASTIDDMGLIPLIDAYLPLNKKFGSKVSHGHRVASMILNGLGFMDYRLYMFPEFMANKPVERLLGEGMKAEYFNDDALGRTLDCLDEYGTMKLFSELAFTIGTHLKLIRKSSHLDTTTLSVWGAYEEDNSVGAPSTKTKPPSITDKAVATTTLPAESKPHPTYGYPKNGRFDLKQMVLLLATTGKAGFPLWMESHSGNMSDKVSLQAAAERMHAFYTELKRADDHLFVMDSAGYDACLKNEQTFLWLSRVPETHTFAREKLSLADADVPWKTCGMSGYKRHVETVVYKGVRQRWALVFSEKAYEREAKTVDKNIIKEKEALDKACAKLMSCDYGCEKDARKALKAFEKTMKYHKVGSHSIDEIHKYKGRGRPKVGEEKQFSHVRVTVTLVPDEERITLKKRQKGRFILATNQLDGAALRDEEILSEYKEQSKTESGFHFIKDNAFEVSSIFLKKPERISALMMIMTLCLMVYNVAQHKLREALKQANEEVPHQLKGKTTQKPTMRWVCQLFNGVSVVVINRLKHCQEIVTNVKDVLTRIIQFFGKRACDIYGVIFDG